MRSAPAGDGASSSERSKQLSSRSPLLLAQAEQLAAYLKALSPAQLADCMHISPALAQKTHELMDRWSSEAAVQTPAIDSFVGDIYSGLQVRSLSPADRAYADDHLRILSGLYGILRALDGIVPYRLEMGYKLPPPGPNSLYDFWGRRIADTLPTSGPIINTSSLEYTKTVTPFVDAARIITPKFLTADPKTGDPSFVVVHAKIARGAFARWLIVNRVANLEDLPRFTDLGYRFSSVLSTPAEPAYVCETFGGKGLSMRIA